MGITIPYGCLVYILFFFLDLLLCDETYHMEWVNLIILEYITTYKCKFKHPKIWLLYIACCIVGNCKQSRRLGICMN